MILLFSLPTELWRDHIFQCLTLVDIVRASSACLDRDVQLQFRSLLDGLTLKSEMLAENKDAEKMRWCVARNVLPSMVMASGEIDAHTASIFPSFCARVAILKCFGTKQKIEPTNCSRLVSLEYWECPLTDLGSRSVCSNLTSLTLSGCPQLTTELLLNSLAGCVQLTECTVESCDLVDQCAIVIILNQCPKLVSLRFGGSANQSYNLSSIVNKCTLRVPTLRSFVISYYVVCNRGMGLQRLARLFPLLQKLHLNDSVGDFCDDDVEFLSRNLPTLKDVSFRGFTRLTSSALESLVCHLPLLQHLGVASCSGVSNEGIIKVAKGCAALVHLDISYCTNVTDEAVQAVWNHGMLLQNLNIAGCVQITDASFAPRVNDTLRVLNVSRTQVRGAFFGQIPKLVRLYCQNCPNIGSSFVHTVADVPNVLDCLQLDYSELSVPDLLLLSVNLPHVRTLMLSYSFASDAVLRSCIANCPKLRYVSVFGCEGVTQTTVDELKRFNKKILGIFR